MSHTIFVNKRTLQRVLKNEGPVKALDTLHKIIRPDAIDFGCVIFSSGNCEFREGVVGPKDTPTIYAISHIFSLGAYREHKHEDGTTISRFCSCCIPAMAVGNTEERAAANLIKCLLNPSIFYRTRKKEYDGYFVCMEDDASESSGPHLCFEEPQIPVARLPAQATKAAVPQRA